MSTHSSMPVPDRSAILRKQRWTTLLFALVILVPCFYGFGRKFYELVLLTRGDVDGIFAISPVVNYLLASLGFFCLLCWAIANGMFGDIEKPKIAMLETERRLDDEDID